MSKDKKAVAPQWSVVFPVEVDQTRYAPGERIALTEEQAAPLLAVGAITNEPQTKGGNTDGNTEGGADSGA